MAARKNREPTYTAASEELDSILDDIENGNTDIDVLSQRVGRAGELIRFCRAALENTELSVQKVVEELSAEGGATDSDSED